MGDDDATVSGEMVVSDIWGAVGDIANGVAVSVSGEAVVLVTGARLRIGVGGSEFNAACGEGESVTGRPVVEESGLDVEGTMAGATVGDETGGAVGDTPAGSLVQRGDVVSITGGEDGSTDLGAATGGSDPGATCEGDRVTGGVVTADSGVVEGITAVGEVGIAKRDAVGNVSAGAVVLTGCVVSVNGGEDRSAALGASGGSAI